jgi:ActR/RegA family two-component response regulator
MDDVPSVDATIDQVKRWHVQRVLAAFGGNKTKAARSMGITKPGLNYMLAKWPDESEGILLPVPVDRGGK